jgi:hypothetical protein
MTIRKRHRHRPSQVGEKPSSVQAFSVKEFFAEFDACLERIMDIHPCIKCGRNSTFH